MFDDHDPASTISITIVPAAGTGIGTGDAQDVRGGGALEVESPARRLYAALSACADLHPDAVGGSDGDGDEGEGGVFEGDGDVGGGDFLSDGGGGEGLPPPMAGSGGWITAENVGEFFDGEGNWRGNGGLGQEVGVGGGGGGLGEGAGVVRTREEDDDGEEVEGDGEGEDDGTGETKWRRTE